MNRSGEVTRVCPQYVVGLIMSTIRALIAVTACIIGCDRPDGVNRSVDDYIASWGEMGMMLPDAAQVKVFHESFDSADSSLRKALSHPDDSVRMRAAYVIGELGATAKPVGEDLFARLTQESDELVRIYIVDALIAVGYKTEESIAVLSERYEALDGSNVPPNNGHSYAEVDEKIKIASALYSLAGTESKPEYYDFVTQWLDPPADGLNRGLIDGYWERRWMAVNSLEQMPTATGAIPKLEALQAEAGAKSWVNVHVPRVLDVLRQNAH